MIGNGTTPGLWPSLATALGADSFKVGNEAMRWEIFFASDSAWAGSNIKKLRAAPGGGTLRNHNSVVDLLSFWLARASVGISYHIAEASKASHRPAKNCSAGSAPDAGIDSESRGQKPSRRSSAF
jgi:hypothetical protein